VCPLRDGSCPKDAKKVCPKNMEDKPTAGSRMTGSPAGCQCVPDFLISLVMGDMEKRDAGPDVIRNKKVKVGKRTCTCTFILLATGSKLSTKSKASCDKKCSGTARRLKLKGSSGNLYTFDLKSVKGKATISKGSVELASPEPTEPTEPTGPGSGSGSGPRLSCSCVYSSTGHTPPTGPGSGSESGSGSGSENGSGSSNMTGPGSGSETGPGSGNETGLGSGSESGSGSGNETETGSGNGSGSGSGEDLKLRQLSRSRFPLARCNDGTQATYYVQPGRHSGKVMIWLQGGGACWSEEMCNERCASSHEDSELCTAQNEAEITFRGREEGVLDPYADYWMVYVHYCSSDLWAGTKSASQATGGYHFLGKYIIEAVIEDLTSNYNLQNANTVVFTGCSAGAVGVTLNCDDIGAKLPSADFRCVADAPDFFPPDTSIAPGCFARDPQFQNKATEFWGRKYDQSCQEFADNTGVKNVGELCGVLARSLEFVSSPILVMTPFFDPAITIIHGCQESYEEQGDQEFEKFKERWMTGHKKEVDNLMSTKPEIAFFVPNCVIHCMTYGYPDLSVKNSVTGQQTGIAGFISGWLAGDGKSPLYAVDEITITNPTCEDED